MADGGEELPTCGICFTCIDDENPRGVLNGCDHIFCHYCIVEWAAQTNVCPQCRARFKTITTKDPKDPTKPPDVKSYRKKNFRNYDEEWSSDDEDAIAAGVHAIMLQCSVCEGSDRPETMILCDRRTCAFKAHLRCVGLMNERPDVWLCDDCRARVAASASSATATAPNLVINVPTPVVAPALVPPPSSAAKGKTAPPKRATKVAPARPAAKPSRARGKAPAPAVARTPSPEPEAPPVSQVAPSETLEGRLLGPEAASELLATQAEQLLISESMPASELDARVGPNGVFREAPREEAYEAQRDQGLAILAQRQERREETTKANRSRAHARESLTGMKRGRNDDGLEQRPPTQHQQNEGDQSIEWSLDWRPKAQKSYNVAAPQEPIVMRAPPPPAPAPSRVVDVRGIAAVPRPAVAATVNPGLRSSAAPLGFGGKAPIARNVLPAGIGCTVRPETKTAVSQAIRAAARTPAGKFSSLQQPTPEAHREQVQQAGGGRQQHQVIDMPAAPDRGAQERQPVAVLMPLQEIEEKVFLEAKSRLVEFGVRSYQNRIQCAAPSSGDILSLYPQSSSGGGEGKIPEHKRNEILRDAEARAKREAAEYVEKVKHYRKIQEDKVKARKEIAKAAALKQLSDFIALKRQQVLGTAAGTQAATAAAPQPQPQAPAAGVRKKLDPSRVRVVGPAAAEDA